MIIVSEIMWDYLKDCLSKKEKLELTNTTTRKVPNAVEFDESKLNSKLKRKITDLINNRS